MTERSNTPLEPCPCCGYRAEIEQVPHERDDENSGGYYIECKRASCGITTRLAFACKDDPIPSLVESWNRRTMPSETARIDVEGRDFYELCQAYRWERGDPVPAFEALKKYIKTGELPWPSYEEPNESENV